MMSADDNELPPPAPTRPDPHWTTGFKQVLYVRATFADQPAHQPQTLDSARRSLAFVDRFVRDNSYGRTAVRAAITDVIVLPHDEEYYMSPTGYVALRRDALAAAEARRPAWDADKFDFDVIRYDGGPTPGDSGHPVGFGNVNARGAWVRTDAPSVLMHELGHNLGLEHANRWAPDDPDAPTGPGHNAEYGNPLDVMGTATTGDGGLGAYEREFLSWLPAPAAPLVTAGGTYRLFPVDSDAAPAPGQDYALRLRKDERRDYWLSTRSRGAGAGGLEVNWGPWFRNSRADNSNGGAQLLDMTPQTASADDAALPLGRTFSDLVAGLHVTPLRRNDDGSVDVRVNVDDAGGSPDAAAPSAPALSAARVAAKAGAPVIFTAASTDGDGDDLSYAWDFGDGAAAGGWTGQAGALRSNVTHAFAAPGDYRVRVTFSDLRGRTSSSSVVVHVTDANGAAPPAASISGRVLDAFGRPVQDVRVGDGAHWAYTDADGRYTLPGLSDGALTLAASKPGGWAFAPAGFDNPLRAGPATPGVDFRGTAAGYTISGTVATPVGKMPVGGVVVSDGIHSDVTDMYGAYSLPAEVGLHTLTFKAPGYVVVPRDVAVEYADVSLDVDAETGSANGFIRGLPRDTSIDVRITDGKRVAQAQMDYSYGDPYYVLPDLPAGNWTLSASARGPDGTQYTLVPSGWTNPLAVDENEQGVNFVVAPDDAFNVNGRVFGTPGVPVGVTVTATDRFDRRRVFTADIDDLGQFVLTGLSPSLYTFAVRDPVHRDTSRARVTYVDRDLDGLYFLVDTRPAANTPPTFTFGPRAEQRLVTGTSTYLVASGIDREQGQESLAYTWHVDAAPQGGSATFTKTGAGDASRTLVTFTRAGAYSLSLTVDDGAGGSVSGSVSVIVVPVLSNVRVGPDAYHVLVPGASARFTAVAVDQFGNALAAQPPVKWSASGPAGAVDAAGLFTAADERGVRGSVVASVAAPGGAAVSGAAAVDVLPNGAVVGRHVFYSGSELDPDGDPDTGDDAAVAPDKSALLPGQSAAFANYTSYDRGLNGILVDLSGAWSDEITAGDFEFAVSTGLSGDGWAPAPAPREVAVRRITLGGRAVDRVALVWDDGAVANRWLRVRVLPTQRTGLAAADVFYFGNLAGDVGDAAPGASEARVTPADLRRTLAHAGEYGTPVDPWDHDRDAIITDADADVVRRNLLAALGLIAV